MKNTNQKVKASNHESYGMFTILAILLAPIAFIIGIVFITKPNALDRKLGEHLIAFSVFIMIISTILWYIFFPRQLFVSVPIQSFDNFNSTQNSSWDIDTVYAQIKEGMNKSEVKSIIGRDTFGCGESDYAGVIYETCTYGGLSSNGIIQVNYLDGIVSSKSKSSM